MKLTILSIVLLFASNSAWASGNDYHPFTSEDNFLSENYRNEVRFEYLSKIAVNARDRLNEIAGELKTSSAEYLNNQSAFNITIAELNKTTAEIKSGNTKRETLKKLKSEIDELDRITNDLEKNVAHRNKIISGISAKWNITISESSNWIERSNEPPALATDASKAERAILDKEIPGWSDKKPISLPVVMAYVGTQTQNAENFLSKAVEMKNLDGDEAASIKELRAENSAIANWRKDIIIPNGVFEKISNSKFFKEEEDSLAKATAAILQFRKVKENLTAQATNAAKTAAHESKRSFEMRTKGLPQTENERITLSHKDACTIRSRLTADLKFIDDIAASGLVDSGYQKDADDHAKNLNETDKNLTQKESERWLTPDSLFLKNYEARVRRSLTPAQEELALSRATSELKTALLKTEDYLRKELDLKRFGNAALATSIFERQIEILQGIPPTKRPPELASLIEKSSKLVSQTKSIVGATENGSHILLQFAELFDDTAGDLCAAENKP